MQGAADYCHHRCFSLSSSPSLKSIKIYLKQEMRALVSLGRCIPRSLGEMMEVVQRQALFCRSWAGDWTAGLGGWWEVAPALGGLESCRGIGDPWGFPLIVTEAEHWGNFTGKPSLDLGGFAPGSLAGYVCMGEGGEYLAAPTMGQALWTPKLWSL
uniref:Uncharacterized protein n=1 Tax=Pipistrellus kuhlii TaxID=59472 RepID=A0A7J7T0W2_PIPKU|nr:hypothetical protein mPipKuh1_009738 [Pipistrellus kuhlii]